MNTDLHGCTGTGFQSKADGRDGLRAAVVVCTRDRPEDLRRCLTSLARSLPEGCRLVVVDQSRDGAPGRQAVREAGGAGAAIEYLASVTIGLSAARNEGVRAVDGCELILFTDDDCEVAPGWVGAWQSLFSADPRIGIGFGPVITPPFDPRSGHIPHFQPGSGPRTWGLELFARGAEGVGMGANMVVRRGAWAAAGGFDETLGAGAPFPAAEELDLAYRIGKGGKRLAHGVGPAVVHYGFRAGAGASRLAKGYAGATAAMYVKHVRCGDRLALRLLARETGHLAARVGSALMSGSRPLGLRSLAAFLAGLPSAWRQPLDVERRLFIRAGVGSLAPQP